MGAAICNRVYLFRLKVRTLPSGRCFCRRHEAAVDRHGMAHVRGEVLGSRQPDRLVVFTSSMHLPFLDLRQPLIILSPLFAELAIEPGCESCCIEGAECSLEAGGACCVPCAIDAALNSRQVTSIGRIFSIGCSPGAVIGVAPLL